MVLFFCNHYFIIFQVENKITLSRQEIFLVQWNLNFSHFRQQKILLIKLIKIYK